MSETRPEQGSGTEPAEAGRSGGPGPHAPWNDFGVPHGGHPDPEPYRPAMFHGPGRGDGCRPPVEQTQPIEALRSDDHPQASPSWWGTPASGGSAPMGAPPAGPPPTERLPYVGGAPGLQPSPHQPSPDQPAGRSRHRGRGAAGVAAISLVSALIGGGAVLAGGQYLDRGTTLGSAVPAPGPGSTARPEGSIAKIAATALPSVVTIKIRGASGSGTGSGFVIDRQGHILTNNHVVAAAGGAGTINVELNNGTTIPAQVAGKDASYDLAVLKVEATDLVPLEFGRSTDVVVGDGVIAVGAPLGLDATVTSGIVSALNRPVTPGNGDEQSYINAIQTDAAINPGNSGGPLLDMNGRVIGVNSAIARVPGTDSSTGGNIGVGFSIPSDQASKTAQQLITTGKAEHPVLGVKVDRGYDGDGARLAQDGGVEPGSAAEKAGLKNADVVVEFDGRKVTDADALIVSIRAKSVGDTVRLKVLRGGQTVDVTMTLQAAPG
jgi:putative serine protease PepD